MHLHRSFTLGSGIFTVNMGSGALTQIRSSDNGLEGLTYIDGVELVGVNDGSELYVVTDGTTNLLNAGGGFINDSDMAYHPSTGLLWASDWSRNVYSYDVINSYVRTTLVAGAN